MPCRPSTSARSTRRPSAASASARAAATVVLPVPPLPVTTWSRTPSQSVSRAVAGLIPWLTLRRLPNGYLMIYVGRHRNLAHGLVRHLGEMWPSKNQAVFTKEVPAMSALFVLLLIIGFFLLIAVGRGFRVVQ